MKSQSAAVGAGSTVNPVCQRRIDLLDQLASTIESLGRAKLHLIDDFDQSVGDEIVMLRDQCGKIRGELEVHRARHGC